MGRDTTIGTLSGVWQLETGCSTFTRQGSHAIEGGAYFGSFPSHAILGGGHFGIFSSQSIEGGGSVSGVPCGFPMSGSAGDNDQEQAGCWVKLGGIPASDMTIYDFNAGSPGYFRLKVTSTPRFTWEWVYNGLSLSSTPAITVATGVWIWVSAAVVTPNSSAANSILRTGVTTPGGIVTTDAQTGTGASRTSALETCTFGWGVSQSSTYLAFPNSSGWELSKFQSYHNSSITFSISAPTADISAGGYDLIFNCRDSLGAFSTLADTSGNAFNLTVGAQGGTVVADGPYAS